VIRPEDRGIVIAVATQIFCARLQSQESKRPTGDSKHGYSPDLELCVGEAAGLVTRVDSHIAPLARAEAIVKRHGKRQVAVELTFSPNGSES
jgi:hypothetical protein